MSDRKKMLIHSPMNPIRLEQKLVDGTIIDRSKYNFGNYVFAEAAFIHFNREYDVYTDNYYILRSDVKFDPGWINSEFDVYVIPAANWLASYFFDSLQTLASRIKKLKIPCIVLGIGAQSDYQYSFANIKCSKKPVSRFLSAVLEKSTTVGVRGYFSADFVNQMGFKNIDVIGCPSMYINGPDFRIDTGRVRTGKFAFSSHVKFFNEIQAILLGKSSYTYFCQGELIRFLNSSEQMSEKESHVFATHERIFTLFKEKDIVTIVTDVTKWRNCLKAFDFYIGMRIHGALVSLQSGTPAYMLYHDSRTRELSEYYNIPSEYYKDFDFNQDMGRFEKVYNYDLFNKVYPERYSGFLDFLDRNGIPI